MKFVCILLLLGLAACGDGTDATTDTDPAPDPESDAQAQYLVGGVVYAPEGPFAYGVIVDELTLDVEVDLETSGIFPGLPTIGFPDEPNGTFYVGLVESPRIIRYHVDEEGTLTETGELSVLPFGQISAGGSIVIINESRAYFFSGLNLDLVVFDPTEMVLLELIELDIKTPEGGQSYFSYTPARDGDRIVITASHVRADVTTSPNSQAIFIDALTGEVEYDDLEGCGGFVEHAKDAEGNLFFSTFPRQSAMRIAGLAGDPACPGCIARIAKDASRFDTQWIDLVGLAGSPAGSLAQGPGNTSYIMVYDDEETPVTQDSALILPTIPSWSYAAIDLTNPTTLTPVPGLPTSAGVVISFSVVEGDAQTATPFIGISQGDFAGTDLYDMSDPSAPELRMRLPGLASGALRLR
ncbi:MAG: hypothetical protein AAF500_01210 [Myxococcota bacterium]